MPQFFQVALSRVWLHIAETNGDRNSRYCQHFCFKENSYRISITVFYNNGWSKCPHTHLEATSQKDSSWQLHIEDVAFEMHLPYGWPQIQRKFPQSITLLTAAGLCTQGHPNGKQIPNMLAHPHEDLNHVEAVNSRIKKQITCEHV